MHFRQGDLILSKFQWIFREIIATCERIRTISVFVRAKRKFGLRDSRKNLFEFLVVERVTVLNRPHVIRADTNHRIVSLNRTIFNSEVGWQVVHYASSERLFPFEIFAIHLLQLINAGCFEVVTQT